MSAGKFTISKIRNKKLKSLLVYAIFFNSVTSPGTRQSSRLRSKCKRNWRLREGKWWRSSTRTLKWTTTIIFTGSYVRAIDDRAVLCGFIKCKLRWVFRVFWSNITKLLQSSNYFEATSNCAYSTQTRVCAQSVSSHSVSVKVVLRGNNSSSSVVKSWQRSCSWIELHVTGSNRIWWKWYAQIS